jgi:hypothetical protein
MPTPLLHTRFYYFIILFALSACAKTSSLAGNNSNNSNSNNNNNNPSGSSYSLSYDIMIAWHQAGTNTCFIDNYTDSAFMRVDVINDVVAVSNIINQYPSTTPKSGPDPLTGNICTWIPDTTGMINIKGAEGTVSPVGNVA